MFRFKIYCFLFVILACAKEQDKVILEEPFVKEKFNDTKFVINSLYNKGDVRRYGLFPNKKVKPSIVNKIIKLSSQGLNVFFPKGYYPINLNFEGVTNGSFYFDNVVIGGRISIVNKNKIQSSKIRFDGELTLLDKLFIKSSNNISFQTVRIDTDKTLNLHNKKNNGVSIYAGSDKIFFSKLIIKNTGGNSLNHYKLSAAALQVHGWNNNPTYLIIDHLEIVNAARTGLYLTGENHFIKKTIIKNFGLGNNDNMLGLEDATPGEEREFAGAWINKCNNCHLDSLNISQNNNHTNALYSLKLDKGKHHKPTFINNIHIYDFNTKLVVKDDELTNILVKNEY